MVAHPPDCSFSGGLRIAEAPLSARFLRIVEFFSTLETRWRSAVNSNSRATFLRQTETGPGRGDDAKEKGTERQSARSRRRPRRYFFSFVFFVRAAEPYRLLKHFRHRRSRRSMKLGARSLLPQ